MTPFEKSSLVATWLQTIAVVLGIATALFQLLQAQESLEKSEGKEIYTLLERYTKEVEQDYELLWWFYKRVGGLEFYRNEEKQKELLKEIESDFSGMSFQHSSDTVKKYYKSVGNCIDAGLCTNMSFLISSCMEIQSLQRQIHRAKKNKVQKSFLAKYESNDSFFYKSMQNREISVCPDHLK